MTFVSTARAALLGAAALAGSAALADDTSNPTELEQLNVYAPGLKGGSLGGSTVTQEDIRQFNRDTLDTAVQLSAGTSVSAVGARNETNVWIRGFERWRVPLYWDGIPIYLPVDNRIDFGRFSTLDLAHAVQHQGCLPDRSARVGRDRRREPHRPRLRDRRRLPCAGPAVLRQPAG